MHIKKRPLQGNHVLLLPLGLIILLLSQRPAKGADEFLYFNTNDTEPASTEAAPIRPWKIVALDPEYGGQWVVAGDMVGDGAVEIVSAENFNEKDVHYTSAVAAQTLDGRVLWRWGDHAVGRKNWHHDVACQIHDWDGDGKNEVVLATRGFIVELDGASGKEKRRIEIARDATDCIVFCNLSGGSRPTDILVKNRYRQIWAYNREGTLLWTVKEPGGYRTAHQPRPMDLDGDGQDEIFAGYAMLNHDGSVRWVYRSGKVDQRRGHLDCARVVQRGKRPEAFRIALTCCGANNIALIDGTGKVLWEVSGQHFESIDVGRILPNHPGEQILVDIDHQPYGKSPLWVLDEEGQRLGQIATNYCRHHALLDWTGDGTDEILVAHERGMYDYKGRRIGTFVTPGRPDRGDTKKYEKSLLIGDMTGDGIKDVMLVTPQEVYIYRNTKGKKPAGPVRLGTEFNFTLY